jgi:hypothetical protein
VNLRWPEGLIEVWVSPVNGAKDVRAGARKIPRLKPGVRVRAREIAGGPERAASSTRRAPLSGLTNPPVALSRGFRRLANDVSAFQA